eukprot:1152641-Pelagomonas_calceolata.AAC.5
MQQCLNTSPPSFRPVPNKQYNVALTPHRLLFWSALLPLAIARWQITTNMFGTAEGCAANKCVCLHTHTHTLHTRTHILYAQDSISVLRTHAEFNSPYLHGDNWVDDPLVRAAQEEILGFTPRKSPSRDFTPIR